ncbi:MAG: hypothetical protein R2911_31090 [Caldilineaceae bacterium]
MAGVTGLMITAALLMGPVLLLLRRWHLPPGSLTLIWGVNTAAMLIINYERTESIWMAAAMLMARRLADWLRYKWGLGPGNLSKLHLFAFLAPHSSSPPTLPLSFFCAAQAGPSIWSAAPLCCPALWAGC